MNYAFGLTILLGIVGTTISQATINHTVFRLFTRSNRRFNDILETGSLQSINSSHFNSAHSTRFIVHGFRDTLDSKINTLVKESYLDYGEFNVIIVDFSKASEGILNYEGMRPRLPWVGGATAQLIDFMSEEAGLRFNTTHIVGYGIGAHIAGFAGKLVTKGRIEAIYALDAAELRYQNVPTDQRLHQNDANYVEAIHTSVGVAGLGYTRPLGVTDFYVNFGSQQPGCGINFFICSHERAIELFAESITSKTGFYGVQCDNYQAVAFLRRCNRIGTKAVKMGGAHVDNMSKRGIIYVPTNPRSPFALGQQATVSTTTPSTTTKRRTTSIWDDSDEDIWDLFWRSDSNSSVLN